MLLLKMSVYLFPSEPLSAAHFLSGLTFCFPEEVMLAEENKNSGNSALDGKSTTIFVFFWFRCADAFLLSSLSFTFCLSTTESV